MKILIRILLTLIVGTQAFAQDGCDYFITSLLKPETPFFEPLTERIDINNLDNEVNKLKRIFKSDKTDAKLNQISGERLVALQSDRKFDSIEEATSQMNCIINNLGSVLEDSIPNYIGEYTDYISRFGPNRAEIQFLKSFDKNTIKVTDAKVSAYQEYDALTDEKTSEISWVIYFHMEVDLVNVVFSGFDWD